MGYAFARRCHKEIAHGKTMSVPTTFQSDVARIRALIQSNWAVYENVLHSKNNVDLLLECVERGDLAPFQERVIDRATRRAETIFAHFADCRHQENVLRAQVHARNMLILHQSGAVNAGTLATKTCKQLRDLCSACNEPWGGRKQQLLDRLAPYLEQIDGDDDEGLIEID